LGLLGLCLLYREVGGGWQVLAFLGKVWERRVSGEKCGLCGGKIGKEVEIVCSENQSMNTPHCLTTKVFDFADVDFSTSASDM